MMKIKLLLLTLVLAAGSTYFMLATPAIEETQAWRTSLNLDCSDPFWGNCPPECRSYHDCLSAPPAGGCNANRNTLCGCLQDLNPDYNCNKIPTTVGMLFSSEQNELSGAQSYSEY